MASDNLSQNGAAAQRLTRTFLCPECGYDGFKMSEIETTFPDVSIQPGCPVCCTADGRVVMLVETSDPRAIAEHANGEGS